MDWLWVKAIHVAAAVTWVAGLLAATLFVHFLRRSGGQLSAPEARAVAAMRWWDRGFTVPAMVLVWLLGLVLALQLQWSGSMWLWMKVGIVGALSMLHGLCSGTLKRLDRIGHGQAPGLFRFAPVFIVSSVLLIAVLVIVKPL